ncbi:rCG35631, isoform CRA_b [Rattus norvegicus]|uniref:RCG35631, isoform CRA_b n=1 Tax=Rattus norvegicus TaxID=10116 RepID=A6KF79_RAT|nr:rCG35631, isoform CRA_b [Rattus norvegicus]
MSLWRYPLESVYHASQRPLGLVLLGTAEEFSLGYKLLVYRVSVSTLTCILSAKYCYHTKCG